MSYENFECIMGENCSFAKEKRPTVNYYFVKKFLGDEKANKIENFLAE